jgi:glutamate N-acetyltransferase / amino-acid N-acetyltransferase
VESDLPLIVPNGFRASAVKAGIKPSGGLDLAVILADRPCAGAGVFTTNRIAAAPVRWCRPLVPADGIRGIIINAGNANAATGSVGFENARRTACAAADHLGCHPEDVLIASTGVIGRQLPMERVEDGLKRALSAASDRADAFRDASRAILTTDSRPKVVFKQQQIGDDLVTLLGMAKGAAMIGPKMATMLAFFLTDAPIDSRALQTMLRPAVDDSFHCISVEGHTSTNDTVIVLAQPREGAEPWTEPAELKAFEVLLRESCQDLARMIPADGEGATHLVTIDVEGCVSRDEAAMIARAVADSPLVKTAIHGADPNWGRIVSAAGYAGVPFVEEEVSLWLNEILLYRAGAPVEFDAAAASTSIRSQRETRIRLVFTRGKGNIRFWTCDLSADYVRLNAEYTT